MSAGADAAPGCAWCGGPTDAAGRRLIACQRCGAAITFPIPDDAELEEAYGGSYRPAGGRFGAGGDRLLRRSRGTLAARIDARAPAGPVLDVGSGDGALLDALAARGRSATGLERASGDRHDVVEAEIATFDEHAGEWAAVVFWHSLEHLRDAPAALDRACALLAPGGLLIVAVPNRASWQARVLGDRWLALDLPRHLTHLTPDALLGRLSSDGMRVDRVSFWRGGQVLFGWLHGLVGLLPGTGDLYDAIRRPEARTQPLSSGRRVATLAAGILLIGPAGFLAAAEVVAGAGGTFYVEARKSSDG